MIYCFFLYLIHFATLSYAKDYFSDNKVIVENLRRRNVIPLNYINNPYGVGRRFYNDETVFYRKTKNLRQNPIDRRFELSEAQERDANLVDNRDVLEELHSGLRWIPVTDDQQPSVVYVGI